MIVKFVKYSLCALLAACLLAIAYIFYLQNTSDGPIEPMQGGPFLTGEVIETPVDDWSFAAGSTVEFELEGFSTSRMAGYIMHEGEAYMTCDLGYIWNRLDFGAQKLILRTLYTFKHWHTDALEDGRVRIRHEGKIYKTNFVKVEDPELNQQLRKILEAQAKEYFLPMELPPEPTSEPNDIWFFKMEPRT